MIIVTTSSYNKCLYCVVAHGAMLRVFAKKEQFDKYNLITDQIATDYKKATVITERHKAMLDYAVKLTMEPWNVNDDDIEHLMKKT